MLRPPAISVIMIFLNGEDFLAEAIESVRSQSFADWELLLVDDGSTDGATEIARSYAERFPGRIRYLEHPDHENHGMSAARNVGIRAASGEFLAFLDADDVWYPDKLEEDLIALQAEPRASMICGPVNHWHSWRDPAKDDFVLPLGIQPGLYAGRELLRVFLQKNQTLPIPGSLLLRRSAAIEAGGFEKSFRGMHEDQAFYAKFCLLHNILVTDRPSGLYRQHPASACNTAAREGKVKAAEKVYFRWLLHYLADNEVDDPELYRLARRGSLRATYPKTMEMLALAKHHLDRWRGRALPGSAGSAGTTGSDVIGTAPPLRAKQTGVRPTR